MRERGREGETHFPSSSIVIIETAIHTAFTEMGGKKDKLTFQKLIT